MNVAVLRANVVAGSWDPEVFLGSRDLGHAPWWRAGDTAAGRVRSSAGFNLKIANAAVSSFLAEDVIRWMEKNADALAELRAVGAELSIDFGVTVGTSEQFTASVVFSSSHIRRIADAGVSLSLSAYPAST